MSVAVGVCVPVRDEEALLGACLDGLGAALAECDVPVRVVLVLDGCRDRSGQIATVFAAGVHRLSGAHQATVLTRRPGGDVGRARAAGLRRALSLLGAPAERVWLATTDADSVVPPSWLVHQLRRRADGWEAWAGTVAVGDWSERPAAVARMFSLHNARDRPVHGANLGCSAAAYLRAGGFRPGVTGEDRDLWARLGASGARLIHDPGCPVTTSGRRTARAPAGFAAHLDRLEGEDEDAGEDEEIAGAGPGPAA